MLGLLPLAYYERGYNNRINSSTAAKRLSFQAMMQVSANAYQVDINLIK